MRWKQSGIFFLLILSVAKPAPLPSDEVDDPLRLPKTSIPLNYDISLTTNVHTSARAFSGSVKIEIQIKEETDTITLHNNQLTIDSLRLFESGNDGSDISVEFTLDASKSFLHIHSVDRTLKIDELLTIEVTFRGNLQLSMNGFYRSYYRISGETRYLATTQFQRTGARAAFICYDEPEFKAYFKLQITHSSTYTAISNMRGTTTEIENGMTTTSFEETPKMSSYLIAFIVSDFGYTTNSESLTDDETLHRVYARTEEIERTKFALDSSVKFLKQLEDFVKYKYEIPKMWSAAVPDFAAGAMENWGLITYKEQYLIVEEDAHPREYFDSLRVIAHELGHQFFGNLVTCKWWDTIWLNEGFATVYEFLLVEKEYPELRMRDMYSVYRVQNAFRPDALQATHPMTFYGNHQTLIIYDKAGSVIRMFQYAVGEEIFRDAMNVYLTDNNHEPVTSKELYEAFEKFSESINFPFTEAFETWENQKGYPLVHVSASDSSNLFTLTQKRYLAVTEVPDEESDASSWYIPINFATESNPNFDDTTITNFFVDNQPQWSIPYPELFESNQWFVFNKQQLGYYRVNYDEENWRALINVLNSDRFQEIHVSNRAQLIDDSLSLAFDGYLDYRIAFDVLSYLSRETDYIPWRAAIISLDKLDYMLFDQPSYPHFKTFVRKLARQMYITLGLEERSGDNMIDKFGRELAIDWTCRMGDERCLADAWMRLKNSLTGDYVIPDPLEISFICHGIKGMDKEDEFVELWQRMQDSDDQSERIRIIDGLLCADNPRSLRSLLETTLVENSASSYRTHERQRIMSSAISRSSIGLSVVIDFMKEHIDDYRTMFGSADSFILSISQRVSHSDHQTSFKELLNSIEENLSATTIESALKNLENTNIWMESKKYEDIVAILNEFGSAIVEEQSKLVLPTTSEPHYYTIHLDVRNLPLGERAFKGEVTIDIEMKETTDRIMMHSKNQVITELKAYSKDESMTEIPVYDFDLFPETDTLTIIFTRALEGGMNIVVHIKYESELLTNGNGFYQTSYVADGVTKWVASTQFESVEARNAFPDYDEPKYKAKFEISITHDASQHAISNTFGTPIENDDGTITTTFEPSPIMSSYLNAFVVSDLEYISNEETKLADETLHRIWVRPGSTSKAQLALDASVEALKALEEYVNFKYELLKVDSAGVPNKGGAMENWGMIIYRENAMIYEENYEDISHTQKLSGVDVISHELAHQFFGNTVTCEWWDYIWLNEGFATLFEYHLTGILYPEWNTKELFNIRSLQSALRSDASVNTRAMTPVPSLQTPGEIDAAFNYVVYAKAGSVIRMFQYAVGEEIFREALELYLRTNDHKAVTSQQLYEAFQTIMDQKSFTEFNFAEVFSTWELNKGYPIINVRRTEAGELEVTQHRYFTRQEDVESDTSSWYIPINYATATNPDFDDTKITNYFINNQDILTINPSSFAEDDWYVFNKQQLGFYRVNYDDDNWHALIHALNSKDFEKIHVLNRAQILDDAINLAAGDYINYNTVFYLMQYLSRETKYAPWYDADRFITQLYTTFGQFNNELNLFARQLSQRFYETFKLSLDENIPFEELYERYSRELAMKISCRAGNEDCIHDANFAVREFVNDVKHVPKGLENVIYCNGLRGTDKNDEWIALWNKMSESTETTFRSQAINALGCTENSTLLKDYLDSALGSGSNVNYSTTERRNIITTVLQNSRNGLEAVINFLKAYQSEAIFTLNYGSLENMLSTFGATIKAEEHQTIFYDYLETLTNLDTAAMDRVKNVVELNFQAQQQEPYASFSKFLSEITEDRWVLPKFAVPNQYKIHIDARAIPTGSRDFSGEIEIDATILQETDRIIIHSREQTIEEIRVVNKNDMSEIEVLNHQLNPSTYTLGIYFMDILEPDTELLINIKYSAIMQTSQTSYGFHQGFYTIDGETRYLGATQFESSLGSRFAFPHFDEPRYKAAFQLTLTHDQSQHAISNTFGVATENGDGTTTTIFEETPTMSSYLLAFVISDFEMVSNEETKGEDDTLHRVWVRPDQVSKAWFAVETSAASLKALEEYCGFKFELLKVDSAAIPNKGSAMENWGMITYWETAMIYQENYEDIAHNLKLSGVNVISHELAHQFFGNSATFEWWDYLWMSEGFATFFEHQITGILYPEWRSRDFFNLRELQNALRVDARTTTRAMTTSLETPTQIRASFDNIAYDKSGSVIRMFENTVGEELFRASVELYLKTNQRKSVITQNLVDAFTTVMEENSFNDFEFDPVFRSWESQKGYPYITVGYSSSGQFEVTQKRFFVNIDDDPSDTSSWHIPLNFATASDPNFDDTKFTNYFPSTQDVFMIDAPEQFDGSQWFVFNKQQLGYYRVMYDFSNYHALIAVLNSGDFNKIHRLNRAQILDDAINFAQGGYLDYSVVFGLMEYLSRETEYAPWFDADRFITTLYNVFGPFNDDLNVFMRHLSKQFYEPFKLSEDELIPQEEVYERYSRELSTKIACNARNADCLRDASVSVRRLALEDAPLTIGLETVLFCNGIRTLDSQTEWTEIWKKMQNTPDSTFKSRAITALGCSEDPIVLKDYLESTLGSANSVNYTAAERRSVLSSVLNSDFGLQAVIDFMTEFGSSVVANFGYGTWEATITVPARTVKTQAHRTLFNNYLQSVTQLSDDARDRINTIIETNFQLQEQSPYAEFAAFLSRKSENQLRLPDTSEPMYYKLQLDVRNIHTGDRNFRGEVEIDIHIKKPTDRIMIHSKTQVIEEIKAYNKNSNEELEIIDFNLYPATDTLTVYFMNSFVANDELVLNIKYTTVMPTFGSGFYQTNYNLNGVRYVGSTQFQPTGARYAFPNYDEPGFKTRFDLTITHDKSVSAIANTFGTSSENDDGTITTVFEPTPIMSSYLLAFVVSDFEFISNENDKGPFDTLHRIWVRPDSVGKAWYALESSVDVLKALEEYVGFDFELPKVDSAAIPNKNSAMENWGMVTYWETALIYEEEYEDIPHFYKYSGVSVISHELAHQFFGDSVTCQWWDQTWLNEGFATMFASHITGMLHPDWNARHFFNIRDMHGAFRFDSRTTTRPMTNDVLTLSQIANSFDTIAYNKAGSVLRMMQNAVGENVFRAALKFYLETNDHKPVISQDLVDAFTTVMQQQNFNDFNFDDVMRSWERQAGYPMISVSYSPSGQFEVTQKRFFTNIDDNPSDTSSWHIPLNFATASDPNFDDTKFTNYFPSTQNVFMIDAPEQFDGSQWFVFNKQQLGYYRVMYDFNNWHNLIVTLNSDDYDKIHVLNRAQLVDDAINFAQGGYLDYEVLFGILGYLERETEYTPWYSAELFINTLYNTFGPLNEDLNMFVRHLSENLYEKYRVPEGYVIPYEELYERYNREIAMRIACNAGNEQCLLDTYIQNHLYADHDRKIPKGLESVIFCSGARGPEKQGEWTSMWRIMQITPDTTLKIQLLSALGCSDNPIILKDYLESTLGSANSVNYTAAERQYLLSSVLNSHSGLQPVINFITDYELDIIRSFSYESLEELLMVPAITIKTEEQRAIFNSFIDTLTHLDAESRNRILAVADKNLQVQQETSNTQIMRIVHSIVESLEGSTDPTDPTDPTDTTDPTDPTDTTDPTDLTDPTDPTDPTDSTDPTDPTDTASSSTVSGSPDTTNSPDTTSTTNSPEPASTPGGASSLSMKLLSLIFCMIMLYVV